MKAAGAKNKDQTAREEGQPDGKLESVELMLLVFH